MREAFLIMAHKEPDHVQRLIDRLDGPHASFLLHIGRAKPDIYDEMVRRFRGYANVGFVRRHTLKWGGFGHTAATLAGIRQLLETGREFDYALLISGQDYPIKSTTARHELLARRPGWSYLDHFRIPLDGFHPGSLDWTQQRGGLDRIERWHVRLLRRHHRIPNRVLRVAPRRRFPPGLVPHGGQAYWTLTPEAVRYVDEFLRRRPDVLRFFRFVDVPDELLFHTVLLSSPLADRIVNDDLRYIVWDRGLPHPNVLTSADFDSLASSGDLFARKFDVAVDADVLDRIDAELLSEPARARAT